MILPNPSRQVRLLVMALGAVGMADRAAGDGENSPPAITTPSSGTAIEALPLVQASPAPISEKQSPGIRPRSAETSQLALKVPEWRPQTLLPLAGVLVVILLAGFGIRRLLPASRIRGGGPLRIVQRVHLSSKQSVALLQVGRRLVLVGVTPDRFTVLSEIGDAEECARVMAGSEGRYEAAAEFGRLMENQAVAYERAPVEAAISGGDHSARLREVRGSVRGVLDRLKAMRTESGQRVDSRVG